MTCCICGRPLGRSVDQHHLIPKTFKGKQTVPLHRICHRKIHATFTERELLHHYHTPERLLEHEDIQRFVQWVANKDVDFYDSSKETNTRKRRRR